MRLFRTGISRRAWIPLGVLLAAIACLATLRLPQNNSRLLVFSTATSRANLELCGCPVNPVGGVSRRAAFIRSHAPSGTPVLLLDGGDAVGPPTAEGLVKSQFMFRAMEEMGYTALGIGARDFSFGADFLRSVEEKHGLSFVGTNLVAARTGAHLFRPFAVLRIGGGKILGIPFGGIKVGVLSAMGQDLVPFIPGSTDSAAVLNPTEAVRSYAARIRSECDLVAVLAYADQPLLDSLTTVPGVDIVIATRTLNVPPGYRNVGMRGRVALAYTGYEARRLGVMRVQLSGSGEVIDAQGDLVTLSAAMPEDETVKAIVKEARQAVTRLSGPGQNKTEPPAE